MNQLITHEQLIIRAKKWLANRCGVVLTEYKSYSPAIPDAIGFNHFASYVIECKVSRSDFMADQKKAHRNFINQLGNYRYYFCPPNIVCAEDVPDPWGLLYVLDKKIVKVKEAVFINGLEVRAAEWQIMYSLARRIAGNNLLDKAMEKF
jgi:hypothetical protein